MGVPVSLPAPPAAGRGDRNAFDGFEQQMLLTNGSDAVSRDLGSKPSRAITANTLSELSMLKASNNDISFLKETSFFCSSDVHGIQVRFNLFIKANKKWTPNVIFLQSEKFFADNNVRFLMGLGVMGCLRICSTESLK